MNRTTEAVSTDTKEEMDFEMNNTAAVDDVDSINFMYFYIQLSTCLLLPC